MTDEPKPASLEQLADEPPPGILREFGSFLIHNKKWWLIPIVAVLGLMAALAALLSSPAAPFIYPLF